MSWRRQFEVVNCTDCAPETSCYHCLRDYSNQSVHSVLQRGKTQRFLEALKADLTPLTDSLPGATRVISANPALWLLRQIEQAKVGVAIAAEMLTLRSPEGTLHTWLDLFQELLQRGVKVELDFVAIADKTPEGLSLARHLQLLLDKGATVAQIAACPEWPILIELGP